MGFDNHFDQWTDREQREFGAAVFNYFTGADQRHQQILDRLDLGIAALAAGLRAAADVLARNSQR